MTSATLSLLIAVLAFAPAWGDDTGAAQKTSKSTHTPKTKTKPKQDAKKAAPAPDPEMARWRMATFETSPGTTFTLPFRLTDNWNGKDGDFPLYEFKLDKKTAVPSTDKIYVRNQAVATPYRIVFSMKDGKRVGMIHGAPGGPVPLKGVREMRPWLVAGMTEEEFAKTKPRVFLLVDLPAASTVGGGATGSGTGGEKKGPILTTYELQVQKGVFKDEEITKYTEAADIRAHLKTILDPYSRVPADEAKFSVMELGYLKGRLAGEYSNFEARYKWAEEKGDEALKAFNKAWRGQIKSEIGAYLKAPETYDPGATKDGILDFLKAQPAIPTTEAGRALAKVMGDDPSTANERAVMEALYPLDQIKALKGPADPKLAELRADAKKQAQAYIIAPNPASPLAKVETNKLMAFGCEGVPSMAQPASSGGGNASTAPAGKDQKKGVPKEIPSLKDTKQVNAALKGQLSSNSTEDSAGKVYDGKTPAAVSAGDMALRQKCSEFRASQEIAKARETPVGNMTLGTGGGSIENNIGDDKGQEVPGKPDPNQWRDIVTGAKMGILGAIIGGILMGPVGLLFVGGIATGLGIWLSREANK